VTDVDDLVIGSGMGGLTVAALLAKQGRRVLVLEAHDVPGGYAHTFRMGAYRFCAQVHYVFSCGEGEGIHSLLSALGLEDEVPFHRLDPEGFDHVVVAGDRHRIPNGLGKSRDRLIRRYPEAARPLREYFAVVRAIADELEQLDALPDRPSLAALASAWRFRHLLRYRRWTLGQLFERLHVPQRLRAVLAGQCGDYLLPPRDVSLLLHVALVAGYDRGAYYPKKHYFHFVESIAGAITRQPGCAILYEHEVERIEAEGGRVTAVRTKNGKRFTAKRYVSNVDPRRTAELVAPATLLEDRASLRYAYSSGTFTLYLALRGLDLREHGFGSFNVWHYPHDDLERIYDDQGLCHDLSRPWLFLSTPTLHSDEPGLCPPGEQILEVATSCDYARFAALRRSDRRAYNREKKKIRETILDVLEASYVPSIRRHVALPVAGTPVTNERFCFAPQGNSYGSALTPENVGFGRGPRRSALDNLWLVNATAGFPSVAGAIGAGMKLFRELRR
jgi:phytoene dehydrogenase-like protein